MKPYVWDVPALLDEAGIRVLVYAGGSKTQRRAKQQVQLANSVACYIDGRGSLGDADFICNWYGNKAWTERLTWSGSAGFNAAPDVAWTVDGVAAGEAKSYE